MVAPLKVTRQDNLLAQLISHLKMITAFADCIFKDMPLKKKSSHMSLKKVNIAKIVGQKKERKQQSFALIVEQNFN
jgi:hypothetical protein